jgi:hypothetical protein
MAEKTNFFAKFSLISKTALKDAFEMNTWTASRAGGGNYDLKNEWSTLFLEGDDIKPIVTGYINYEKENLRILHNIIDRLQLEYSYELYDDEDNLVLEKERKLEPIDDEEDDEETETEA